MRSLAVVVAVMTCVAAHAADKVKIGFVSTLSGPNASIGIDIRDAFNLAVKLNGGRLGGLPAEVLVNDDQLKPENAKQVVERYLRLDKVDFVTGTVFSNIQPLGFMDSAMAWSMVWPSLSERLIGGALPASRFQRTCPSGPTILDWPRNRRSPSTPVWFALTNTSWFSAARARS